jgi:hypothetical protein
MKASIEANNLFLKIKEIETWIDECYQRPDLLDFNALMSVGILASNHIRIIMMISADTLTPDEYTNTKSDFDLHEAVIIGHFVRIYKLYEQIVFNVVARRGEIASIFNRLIFETYARMKYLILRGRESIDSYIRTSFKATMQNYRFLKEKEQERELDNIEKRMLRKIENRLNGVNMMPDELLQNKNWRLDGKSFSDILDYLDKNDQDGRNWDLGYSFLFGGGSSFVHGDWYDLHINHLEENEDKRYKPRFEYNPVDPRYILPIGLIAVDASMDLLNWRKTDPERFIDRILGKMHDLHIFLNERDEIRIDKRDGQI